MFVGPLRCTTGEPWSVNWGPRSQYSSKAANQGGPFHAVALSLWEHGHRTQADALWREQIVQLRGVSRKDCVRRECQYPDIESSKAVKHKLRHDAEQMRYIASKNGVGIVANTFAKKASNIDRILEVEEPGQPMAKGDDGIIHAAGYTEQQLEQYDVRMQRIQQRTG
jgi:hypothetical protein|eukprot:COSAG02_NODE_250_length_27076_cov_24.440618_3_plen_167_part_00